MNGGYAPDWSEAKTAELRRLHAEGYGHIELARRLNTTRHAVANKARRMNLPPHPCPAICASTWNAEHIDILRQDWLAGKSAGIIAAKLGKTRNAIIGKVHRLKLPTRKGTSERKRPGPKAGEYKRPSRARDLTGFALVVLGEKMKVARTASKPQKVLALPHGCEPKPLLDLRHNHCRYPVGEATGALQRFCALPVGGGASWCPWHCSLVYKPAGSRRRAA